MLPIVPQQVVNKPIPGDLFISKKSIDVIDTNGNILAIRKNDIIRLLEIKNQNAPIRLDRHTKFIANWTCKFFIDKRHFILNIQNTSQDSMFFEHFEALTEDSAEKLIQK